MVNWLLRYLPARRNSRTVWIDFLTNWDNMFCGFIGGGKFGSRAAHYLNKEDPNARIMIVDSGPNTNRGWEGWVLVFYFSIPTLAFIPFW